MTGVNLVAVGIFSLCGISLVIFFSMLYVFLSIRDELKNLNSTQESIQNEFNSISTTFDRYFYENLKISDLIDKFDVISASKYPENEEEDV